MKSNRYLVTGGTGFIGSSLVRELVENGHYVRVLDNNSRGSPNRLENILNYIDYIEGDIRDTSIVGKAVKDIDSVLHLAYVNGTEHFYTKPELILDIAIRGMINILDACRNVGIREMVLTSSSEVYQTPNQIPTPEEVPLIVPDVMNPRYSYGGGKLACELMAINYGRNGFDRMIVVRPHNVYGPDMGWEHVLPQLVKRAVKNISNTPSGLVDFQIQGDGTQTRSFLHIKDFVSGMMRVLDKGEHLNVYNIGTSEEISIGQVVDEIFKLLNREPRVLKGALPAGSTMRRCPDISKLKRLGYKPEVSFCQGLPSLVSWYLGKLSYSNSKI